MDKKRLRQISQQVVNKDKWWDMISRFVDVLRINIFLVDLEGLFILPPDKSRFGGRLLTERFLGFDLLHHEDFLNSFEAHGSYLEAENRYELKTYAVPIKVNDEDIFAYLIVGPVVLNKRLERERYTAMAREFEVDPNMLISELNELRVVSNMMIRSILDLLSEILRDHVIMTLKEKQLGQLNGGDARSQDFERVAREIYSSVAVDELLVTLLDVALKMTGAESGSIMIADKERGSLNIKASRGLGELRHENFSVKLGEGISGIAAQANESFVIKGAEGDSRIKHLLKRPDIKESLVIPLHSKEGVVGVLNLSNKTREVHFEENLDNLKYLTTLVSSAF